MPIDHPLPRQRPLSSLRERVDSHCGTLSAAKCTARAPRLGAARIVVAHNGGERTRGSPSHPLDDDGPCMTNGSALSCAIKARSVDYSHSSTDIRRQAVSSHLHARARCSAALDFLSRCSPPSASSDDCLVPIVVRLAGSLHPRRIVRDRVRNCRCVNYQKQCTPTPQNGS